MHDDTDKYQFGFKAGHSMKHCSNFTHRGVVKVLWATSLILVKRINDFYLFIYKCLCNVDRAANNIGRVGAGTHVHW